MLGPSPQPVSPLGAMDGVEDEQHQRLVAPFNGPIPPFVASHKRTDREYIPPLPRKKKSKQERRADWERAIMKKYCKPAPEYSMHVTIPAREFARSIKFFRKVGKCTAFRFSWHSRRHFSIQPVFKSKDKFNFLATAPAKHIFSDGKSLSLVGGHENWEAAKQSIGHCYVKLFKLGVLAESPDDAVVELSLPKQTGKFSSRIVYVKKYALSGSPLVITLYPPPAYGRL